MGISQFLKNELSARNEIIEVHYSMTNICIIIPWIFFSFSHGIIISFSMSFIIMTLEIVEFNQRKWSNKDKDKGKTKYLLFPRRRRSITLAILIIQWHLDIFVNYSIIHLCSLLTLK